MLSRALAAHLDFYMFPTKKFKVKVKMMLMIVLYEKGKIILHLKSHKKRLKMDTKLNGDDFIS